MSTQTPQIVQAAVMRYVRSQVELNGMDDYPIDRAEIVAAISRDSSISEATLEQAIDSLISQGWLTPRAIGHGMVSLR